MKDWQKKIIDFFSTRKVFINKDQITYLTDYNSDKYCYKDGYKLLKDLEEISNNIKNLSPKFDSYESGDEFLQWEIEFQESK